MKSRKRMKSLSEEGEKRMTLEKKLEQIEEMTFDDLREYLSISRFEVEEEGYDRIALLEMAREMVEEEGDDE